MPLDPVYGFCGVTHGLDFTDVGTGEVDKSFGKGDHFIGMGGPDRDFRGHAFEDVVFFKDLDIDCRIPAFLPDPGFSPVGKSDCLVPEADSQDWPVNLLDVVETEPRTFHIGASAENKPVGLLRKEDLNRSRIREDLCLHVKIPDSPVDEVAKLPVIVYNKNFQFSHTISVS